MQKKCKYQCLLTVSGACDATIACSTCHCVLEKKHFNDLNKGVTEEEKDLLDMVQDVTDT